MPQSASKIYIHTVFSTKNREPFLSDASVREELHAYMGGIANQLECHPVRVGGTADHVHLLTTLARTKTVSEIVKEVRRISSVWIHDKGISSFQWPAGYASFVRFRVHAGYRCEIRGQPDRASSGGAVSG